MNQNIMGSGKKFHLSHGEEVYGSENVALRSFDQPGQHTHIYISMSTFRSLWVTVLEPELLFYLSCGFHTFTIFLNNLITIFSVC